MLKVFEAATSSAVPMRVMSARQVAICPGASQRPPTKVMITIPVMRGLASWTTAGNQAQARKARNAVGARGQHRERHRRQERGRHARWLSTVTRSRNDCTDRIPSQI